MKEIFDILKYKCIASNVIFMIFFMPLNYFTDAAVPIFFILTSNLYDILGYHFILVRREDFLPEKEYVRSYRVIQLMFDITLIMLLGISFGWIPALCGGLLKIFGVQDLLYYVFLKKTFPKIWTWLKWTPLGFFKQKLHLSEVIAQAIAGIILVVLILLHHLKII